MITKEMAHKQAIDALYQQYSSLFAKINKSIEEESKAAKFSTDITFPDIPREERILIQKFLNLVVLRRSSLQGGTLVPIH